MLKALAREPGLSPSVATAAGDLKRALPGLAKVRDSAQHLEDRARGLDRRQRAITPQPIVGGGIIAPHGGLLSLSSLSDNRLRYTADDGSHQEVEVSRQTLVVAQQAIQQVISSLPWRGPPRTFPAY